MKSENNKRKLASVVFTFTVGDMTTTESRDDSAFDHDEADITIISYVIEAAKCGKDVIRVLSDDTDVFVLLVYWVYVWCSRKTSWMSLNTIPNKCAE